MVRVLLMLLVLLLSLSFKETKNLSRNAAAGFDHDGAASLPPCRRLTLSKATGCKLAPSASVYFVVMNAPARISRNLIFSSRGDASLRVGFCSVVAGTREVTRVQWFRTRDLKYLLLAGGKTISLLRPAAKASFGDVYHGIFAPPAR